MEEEDVIGAAKQLRTAINEANRVEAAARRAAEAQAAADRACGPSSTWDSSPVSSASAKPLTRRQRKRVKAARPTPDRIAQVVTAEARAQGHYVLQRVPGPTIVTEGEEKLTISEVVMNRGGTAVERWFVNDRARLFEEPQQEAVRYCRALWHRAGGLSAIDPTTEKLSGIEGMSQQEALDELHDFKKRVPRKYWEVFENVCRFDEEAGVAGSTLANNKRSAIDAAKTCVAFTASLIAQWRRL